MKADIDVRALLRKSALRATAPRLAVLRILAQARVPLSNNEVLERLGQTDWDPATIYRNLIKLRDAGLAPVVSHAGGIARYALAGSLNSHRHPHFVCDSCSQLTCLPESLTTSMTMQGPWAASLKTATIQLHGTCPDCLEPAEP